MSNFRIQVGSSSGTDPVIRVVCRHPRHEALGMKPTTILAELQREQRWDGSGGHYWVRLAPSTKRERRLWQGTSPGNGKGLPRSYRDWDGVEGFHWMRHGKPVAPGDGYAIGQAFHHNARKVRTGTPEPGTLDGITRHIALSPCRCGAPGIGGSADPVEAALESLHASGRDEVDCRELRKMSGAPPRY